VRKAPPPPQSELPDARELAGSTLVALAVAAVLLVIVVLPAEYAIDLTGLGRPLGLTRMGEIKVALRNEAAADLALREAAAAAAASASGASAPETAGSVADGDRLDASNARAVAAPDVEEVQVTLDPGQERRFALDTEAGARVDFEWFTDWGAVAFEMNGAPPGVTGSATSYARADSRAADEGVLTAAFAGIHGWTWRNGGKEAVTVTLRVKGDYKNLREIGR
jgi:hypothetical protein